MLYPEWCSVSGTTPVLRLSFDSAYLKLLMENPSCLDFG